MSALGTKLRRDLVRLRWQAVTIALVVACGVAAYVSLFSAFRSLERARDHFYDDRRFGDAFASCKRAPDDVRADLAAIDGVTIVETREVETVLLPLDDLPEPGVGRIITLEGGREPALNAPQLRSGRLPVSGRENEVTLLESFAEAHSLAQGDTFPAVMNGVRRDLRVVGIALSPEYVFAVGGGSVVEDPSRFAVLWMDRDAVAPVFRMEGAFNDASFRVSPTANQTAVLSDIDRVLRPHGGFGAYGRERQISNMILMSELSQLQSMATSIPTVFLFVAAFLLNVVLSRTVQLQRGQIATLKAVGYSDFAVGMFYLRLVALVAAVGALVGIGFGAWMGGEMVDLYRPYFRFPTLGYQLDTSVVAVALVAALGAAVLGAVATVRKIAALPPAEAMRPESPPTYRATLFERVGLGRMFTTAGHMILRELLRRPVRTSLSVLGIALSIGIMVAGRSMMDAVDAMMDVEFQSARRDDLTVQLLKPEPDEVVHSIASLPGVRAVEPLRTVPVRLHAGQRYRDVALIGHPADADLRRVVVWPKRVIASPENGVLLTDVLADALGVAPGDDVDVELLEGDRRTRTLLVRGIAHEIMGTQAHMELDALRRFLGEEGTVTELALSIDPESIDDVEARLRDMPGVAGFSRRQAFLDRFKKQSAENLSVTTVILTLFASIIAIGVVYNQARISLSVRSRDLASLRVLGFTRAEISRVLLGELAAYVLLAIVPGLWIGTKMSEGLLSAGGDFYRIPTVVSALTYAFATGVVLASATVSALLVRRKLDRLDLVGVLKTRE